MSLKMRRIKEYAHPYWLWEDWQNGMYDDLCRYEYVQKAIEVLGDPEKCKKAMERVIAEWKYSAETNLLSDVKQDFVGDNAWMGAACCSIECKCTVSEVRNAWWRLTEQQRRKANNIADRIISRFKNQEVLGQMSFLDDLEE